MKKLIMIFILAFLANSINFAQWQKVYTNSTWANGPLLYPYKNILFLVGSNSNGEQILRSDDNGSNWNDITSSFPNDLIFHMLSFNNTVFAVLPTIIGQTNYSIYSSSDDGVTWTERSKIDRGAGNGAILSLASDGTNLYAVSNQRSVYKSTDSGSTWTEIVINYTGTSAILSFAASGNTFIATLLGVGAVLSTDGGVSWTLNNSPSIEKVYKTNNDIWGFAGFSGIYKYNLSTNSWENNYLPGSFYVPNSIATNGTQLISSFSGFLTSDTKYYSSNDNGTIWTELTTDTIGLDNKIISPYALAVNSSYYFAAYWKFANSTITAGVYRLPLTTTSVTSEKTIPNSYQLSQNYPNPFNPSTNIGFRITESGFVTLKVYDVLGKEVATLVNEQKLAGNYEVQFDASELSSGIYVYTLTAGSKNITKKMIFLR